MLETTITPDRTTSMEKLHINRLKLHQGLEKHAVHGKKKKKKGWYPPDATSQPL